MTENFDQWVDKAEGDYLGATILAKNRSNKVSHLICFACQQSAEKYLKAFLVKKGIDFPKVHFLRRVLLPLCLKADPEFAVLDSLLLILDPYSVQFRYPGEIVDRRDVRSALGAIKKVRQFVRSKLGLEIQKRLM